MSCQIRHIRGKDIFTLNKEGNAMKNRLTSISILTMTGLFGLLTVFLIFLFILQQVLKISL